MKIQLTIGDKMLVATLLDNDTARDFVVLLPITLTLKDYANTEKVSDLPRKLSTVGAPAGTDASIGDIMYYAPWGNLAIFYRDFRYAEGLIMLGNIEGDDIALLKSSEAINVTIEVADTA